MAEYTTQLGGFGSLWQRMGRNWVHKFTCDLHVSFHMVFHFLVFVAHCLFMPIPNFDIKLFSYLFRTLSSIGLTGSLSGDFELLSELKTLGFLCSHCLCCLVFELNFQLMFLNRHSATRNCSAQNYENSLLNVCGSYGEYASCLQAHSHWDVDLTVANWGNHITKTMTGKFYFLLKWS
jgi:hypothetical protein